MTNDEFRAERERRQLTQGEYAKLLGLSIRTVQAKEQGQRPISERDVYTLELLDRISVENKSKKRQKKA